MSTREYGASPALQPNFVFPPENGIEQHEEQELRYEDLPREMTIAHNAAFKIASPNGTENGSGLLKEGEMGEVKKGGKFRRMGNDENGIYTYYEMPGRTEKVFQPNGAFGKECRTGTYFYLTFEEYQDIAEENEAEPVS